MRVHMLAAGMFGTLALIGCDDTLFYGHSSSGDVPSGTDICAVETIMANQCNVCHSPSGGNQGALDLETDFYTTVVDNVGYYGVTLVVPGDPEGSLLYQKTTDTQPDDNSLGGVMPIGTSGLSDEENEIIHEWIANGASAECADGTTDTTDTTETTDTTGTDDTADTGTAPVEPTWAAVVDLFDTQCVSCHSAALAPHLLLPRPGDRPLHRHRR